jgi:hypothetical protein
MRRRMAALAACFALAGLGSAALAPQAMANREDCPGQFLCLWNGPTFGEARIQVHDNGWQNLSNFGFNDTMSSLFNNTNRYAQIAVDANGNGEKLCIGPGGWWGPVPAQFNNNASSVRLIGPPGVC